MEQLDIFDLGVEYHYRQPLYFDKAAAVCSNSQLYKQAGNGIVVDVFAAILRNLIEVI
jgi:site-specific DNA-cytosine methylase